MTAGLLGWIAGYEAAHMKIERKFTTAGEDAYASLDFINTVSEIRNPDGTVVFRLDEVEVPASWSQVASDVIAQKYFRKAGVPSKTRKVKEKGVPEFLWRSVPAEGAEMGGEKAAISRQKKTRGPTLTRCAICLPASARLPTVRSGSIPVCTGHTASTALHRATTTSTIKPAS